MSDKVDDSMARAQKLGEKVDEDVHEKIDELSQKIRKQQQKIDYFIHEKPYMAIGISFVSGFTLGLILRSLKRRCRD